MLTSVFEGKCHIFHHFQIHPKSVSNRFWEGLLTPQRRVGHGLIEHEAGDQLPLAHREAPRGRQGLPDVQHHVRGRRGRRRGTEAQRPGAVDDRGAAAVGAEAAAEALHRELQRVVLDHLPHVPCLAFKSERVTLLEGKQLYLPEILAENEVLLPTRVGL